MILWHHANHLPEYELWNREHIVLNTSGRSRAERSENFEKRERNDSVILDKYDRRHRH
jgi:hypothetical protein